MYLILEQISLLHIYVAHAYKGKGGEGQKGKFALGPQFVSPKKAKINYYSEKKKTICDTIITHFAFCHENQLAVASL